MDEFFVDEVEAANKELTTIQDILRWAVSYFNANDLCYGHGTDNPWDEALQLILSSINLTLDAPKDIFTARLISREKYCIIKRIVRRVNEHVPVAYLTNKAWFCGHEFYVDERVLIPRSPIGELISNFFSGLIHQEPQYILDMCTGSGCIAIACAYSFPEAKIDAVDISIDALTVAKSNIKKHNLTHCVKTIHSDLFCNLPTMEYNLIITNPPYVNAERMSNLPDEYYHEPKLGLCSGQDGLELARRILFCAPDYLSENGVLICEVGDNMTDLIKQYPNVPFTWLDFSNGGSGVFMLTKEQLLQLRKIN